VVHYGEEPKKLEWKVSDKKIITNIQLPEGYSKDDIELKEV